MYLNSNASLQYTTYLAHGTLQEFDPVKESIDNFKERFKFYCLTNNVKGEGEHAQLKKALFITLILI